jgi:hypothetical protein
MNISVDVSDTRAVVHLEQMPAKLKANLKARITRLTNELLGQVRSREPMRTGYLRSQTHAFVDERQNFIRGRVRIIATGRGRRVGAAFGALEYGAPGRRGRFQVSAYTRGSGTVRAYRRTARIREMRFLRGPAAAMRSRVLAEFQAAINEAIQQP